jgi:tol-pal system protein YbgF
LTLNLEDKADLKISFSEENSRNSKPKNEELIRLTVEQKSLRSSLDRTILEQMENSRKIDELAKQLLAIQNDLRLMSGTIDSRSAMEKPNKERSMPANGNSKKIEATGMLSPQESYSRARNAFDRQDYETALALWSAAAKQSPEQELAPKAIFWQGEAHYQLRNFGEANDKYSEVIDKYPDSVKYPSALLKQGLCLFLLERKKEGEAKLSQLITRFPGRPEAKRAEIFLQKQ